MYARVWCRDSTSRDRTSCNLSHIVRPSPSSIRRGPRNMLPYVTYSLQPRLTPSFPARPGRYIFYNRRGSGVIVAHRTRPPDLAMTHGWLPWLNVCRHAVQSGSYSLPLIRICRSMMHARDCNCNPPDQTARCVASITGLERTPLRSASLSPAFLLAWRQSVALPVL